MKVNNSENNIYKLKRLFENDAEEIAKTGMSKESQTYWARQKWAQQHPEEANTIVGWKTFGSLLENLPQLNDLHPHYEDYYKGWANTDGMTGEGYLKFSLTFFKEDGEFPEVEMPNVEGWSNRDISTQKAILIKQELKKKYEVLNQIDAFSIGNKICSSFSCESLSITYKIPTDTELPDNKPFYDHFSEVDITDEDINEILNEI